MAKLVSTNPAKGFEVIGEVEVSTPEEIEEKVRKANQAKLMWKELGVQKRIELLRPVYEKFKKRAEEIAQLETKEMGKPIRESRNSVNDFVGRSNGF